MSVTSNKKIMLPTHTPLEPSLPLPSINPSINNLHPSLPLHPSSNPPKKNTKFASSPLADQSVKESTELGEYVANDIVLLNELGWEAFVASKRGRGDIGLLDKPHPANRLLKHYKHHGAPVRLSTPDWTMDQLIESVERGPHKSCNAHVDFLQEEFIDMIKKGQWVVLPFSVAKTLPGLRLSPAGAVEQRDRRPRWIGDYSFSGVNAESQPFAAVESMQFGHALERFLRELLLANPVLGPIYLAKTDVSDGFYRIDIAPQDVPKLGLLFPQVSESSDPDDQLVALPLVLPMGWKYSPPIFTTATETVADITNAAIQAGEAYKPHPLESIAAELDEPLVQPTLADALQDTIRQDTNTTLEAEVADALQHTSRLDTHSRPASAALDTPPVEMLDRNRKSPTKELDDHLAKSPLGAGGVSSGVSPSTPLDETLDTTTPLGLGFPPRDPCLPCDDEPIALVDVFVDDFIKAAQGMSTRRRVRSLLFHALDSTFRPNDFHDSLHRREPNSIKKLRKGDCSWSQIKLILGWIVNTASMTISLPEHRIDRLAEILASIPITQKRTSVKKWHKVLGELRSMSLALPGSRHLFCQMQNALSTATKTRIALRKGVHQALNDFRWMHANISTRPTRIAELIPLTPQALGYHDASGSQGAGGVWFPTPALVPREGTDANTPLLWRVPWPQDLIDKLVSDDNPTGTVTSAEFELAGGLLQLDTLAHCYDIRERTIVSKTDNLNTMFWERKGSCTTDSSPAYLLRLFGIHQRHHRYISRHDYQPGVSNKMADDASPRILQDCTPQARAGFSSDFSLAQEDVQRGVSLGRATSTGTHWRQWVQYCNQLGLDPLLETIENKIPILQVFLHRVRSGSCAADKHQVKSRTAEEYLRSVAQTYLSLGARDPRLNVGELQIDFRIRRMLNAYSKSDPPPNRVKPIPVQVIRRIIFLAKNNPQDEALVMEADMIALAFFFLLRPGEYTATKSESTPFEFKDVQLWQGRLRLDLLQATEAELLAASFCSLTFDKQKNAQRGETIGHARSGDSDFCPVRCLARRIIHIRQHLVIHHPNTPLATAYLRKGTKFSLTPSHITTSLKQAVSFLGPTLGFLASDVSARSLRAAGANALLCGGVDTDVIRLLGRWRSDEMLRYLHTSAEPLMRNFARQMLSGGAFTLIPNQDCPSF